MPIEIKLPDLGDGIESGDVLEILVAVGDEIRKDQDIVELETDKATVAVPSSHAGKITKIHVSPGDCVPIGGLILSLEAAATSAPPKPAAPGAKPAAAPPKSAAPKPAAPATPIAQTPPAQTHRPATPTSPPAPTRPAPAPAAASTAGGSAPAGPAVRRFAREVGVDISSVVGSGQGGRITREDVLAVVRQASRPALATEAPAKQETSPKMAAGIEGEQSTDSWGPVVLQRASKIRRTIAAKMFESWSTVPRVTNFDDADITELERIRQSSKADYAAAGVKLTSMPFVIKSCAMALTQHPLVNAELDLDNKQIIYKQYVNIGIAVDTPRGLVVPSLRGANELSISEIARALSNIAENARGGEFSLDDLRGSTFTISNLGAIGGTYSTPIVNTPEVAILLVGRSRKLPVVVNDEVKIRLMMPLSLSYDHRLVDGGTAARFLNDVIGYLGAPSRLLMAP